jgi:hypothetical protein
MWGDDCGAISLITFFRPVSQLFETPFMETHGTLQIFVKVYACTNLCIVYKIERILFIALSSLQMRGATTLVIEPSIFVERDLA